MAELARRWDDLDAELAVDGIGPAPAHRDELLRRWSETGRRYHDRSHLAAVLTHLERFAAPRRPSPVARLGAWYHDAVHDPAAGGGDEERSAGLARDHLVERGAPASVVTAVVEAVRATAGHLADPAGPLPDDRALLLDADLAVLGSDPVRYDAYVAGVRAEWGHLDDGAWSRGRLAVVEALAGRRRLYLTPTAATERTAVARRNLAAEAGRLRRAVAAAGTRSIDESN